MIRLVVLWGMVALGLIAPGSRAAWAQHAAESMLTKDGRHIRLVTDLPDSPQLNEYVAAFDAAVPQWAAYWQIAPERLQDWRLTAYLMNDKQAFIARGLLPRALPDFPNGYQAGDRIWVVNKPSVYYTRHLLLHEGTHALTWRLFGGSGPAWYMEGTAEFLGTHRWTVDPRTGDGALTLASMPAERGEVPDWGRIELVTRGRQQGQVPTIETVMRYSDTAHRDVEPYAWSWLAVTLLEMYPEYRQPLRAAAQNGRDPSPQFTRAFYQQLQAQWPVLAARWRLLTHDMEYGFDTTRHRVDLSPRPTLEAGASESLTLAVTQGWQVAPFVLAAGEQVAISAEGRFTLREQPQRWESEAEGVTLEYHRGQPLGRLLACVLPLKPVTGRYLPELQVVAVGSSGQLTASEASWLLLKINEPAAELADNAGQLQLRFQLQPQVP